MGVLSRLIGRTQPSSREIARQRLQLALVHDRIKMPPELMETLKDELIVVISKHFEIDQEGVRITITQDKRRSRLLADIPVLGSSSQKAGS
ncbi:MAG: cell division topological specificity factor MinE [Anaerolineae bacterium]